MDNYDAPPSPAPAPPTPPRGPVTTEVLPISPRLEELNEAKRDLINRIQNLKQDLQGWRSKLDAQTKAYQKELSDLKTSINIEVGELRKEFQDLSTDLKKQQEEAAETLKSCGVLPGLVED